MQARDNRAVTALERADHVAALDDVAGDEAREHRFEGREHRTGVREREHRPIDHEPRDVHDTVSGRIDDRRAALDVDASMTAAVGRGRGKVGARDHAGRVDRPLPTRGWCGDGWGAREQQG